MTDHWITYHPGASDGKSPRFEVGGVWTIDTAASLDGMIDKLAVDVSRRSTEAAAVRGMVDASGVSRLDTTGAMLLTRLLAQIAATETTRITELVSGLPGVYQGLFERIAAFGVNERHEPPMLPTLVRIVSHAGESTIDAAETAGRFIAFLGKTIVVGLQMLFNPRRWRFPSLVHHMEQVGFNALPIVGLISFLIGIVLAYQGALQLRTFGAEVFVVDLIAVSILRELGILLTAIVVAGRTASAFTAQIGSMRVNEEIDALSTMGISAFDVLVVPRVLALVLCLPLLAFFSDIMGLVGGALMAWTTLGISPQVFILRLHDAIWESTFWVGIVKAPVFGLIIGLIGCFEGLEVESNAQSVGAHTTRAVVESIFLIIVLDALFSIVFGILGY